MTITSPLLKKTMKKLIQLNDIDSRNKFYETVEGSDTTIKHGRSLTLFSYADSSPFLRVITRSSE